MWILLYDKIKNLLLKHRNYILLWQGQFVSSLGDVFYEIALGFFLLQQYKSSALMAMVIAVSAVPGIFAAPFAGVVVDRVNKKWILVTVDLIRGIVVVTTAVWVYLGTAPLWLFFLTGMVITAGGAFFTSCAKSLIPQIVEERELMRANSTMSVAQESTEIGGNAAGGFVYQFMGAGFMFLFNGISYLISGVMFLFLKLGRKRTESKMTPKSFFADLKSGVKFTVGFAGLRDMIMMACCLNFFASGASILLKPLFNDISGLGAREYGIAVGAICIGNLLGMLFTSFVKIPADRKMMLFMISAAVDSLFNAVFPFVNIQIGCVLLACGGFANSIINVFIVSSIQQSVPEKMRGKVFSLISMVSQGITPIAIAIAGVAAEWLNIKLLIFAGYSANLIIFGLFALKKPFRNFISIQPKNQRESNG